MSKELYIITIIKLKDMCMYIRGVVCFFVNQWEISPIYRVIVAPINVQYNAYSVLIRFLELWSKMKILED